MKLSEAKSTSGWSILTAIVVVVGSPLFFTINNWIAATDRPSAESSGHSVPEGYDAVLIGGGTIVGWPLGTIAQNPWGFTACAVATAVWVVVCLVLARKAVASERAIQELDSISTKER